MPARRRSRSMVTEGRAFERLDMPDSFRDAALLALGLATGAEFRPPCRPWPATGR